MKKTITLVAFALGIFTIKAQTVVADFEGLPLAPNSAYTSSTNVPFQNGGASFQHKESGGYWLKGFSYTNKYNDTTAGFGNLYGVKPLKGYNNSNIYTVAQDQAIINLTAPSNTVSGFYITNTTYAYLAMKNGDSFARKFGDTTGTGSGTTIAQGSYPDFFKVTVKGYKAGALLQDSVPFYLADFRFSNNSLDYILNSWQWVDVSTLGNVDSLKFFMYTSDNGSFGPNTPLFFAIDNFTTIQSSVGLAEHFLNLNAQVYPNPFKNSININIANAGSAEAIITDITGKIVHAQNLTGLQNGIDLSQLQNGIYFLQLTSDNKKTITKLIKD